MHAWQLARQMQTTGGHKYCWYIRIEIRYDMRHLSIHDTSRVLHERSRSPVGGVAREMRAWVLHTHLTRKVDLVSDLQPGGSRPGDRTCRQ